MPPTNLVITVTMPIAFGARLLTALANNYKYQATILDETGTPVANPQTADEFATATRVQELKDQVIANEVPDLSKADRLAKIAEVNSTEITVEVTQV